MKSKVIYFVFNHTPMLGRSLIMSSGFFGWHKEDKYIENLQNTLNENNLQWHVKKDDTESDISLISKEASLIICTPGLKYRFFTHDFDKNKIIYLTTMEYASFNTSIVIRKIKEIYYEK